MRCGNEFYIPFLRSREYPYDILEDKIDSKLIERLTNKNRNTDLDYMKDDDYGFVSCKPLPVSGELARNHFLRSLCSSETGERLMAKPAGTTTANNICGPIEIYELYTTKFTPWKQKIYLSIHFKSGLLKLPKGINVIESMDQMVDG